MCRRRRTAIRRRPQPVEIGAEASDRDDDNGAGNEAVADRVAKVDKSGATKPGAADDRVWKSGSRGGSEPCGADGAKRDGGVFADRACPCADWQRSCVGTVCGSRNASDARHTVDGAVRQGGAAGACVGEGSGELSFVMERDRPKAGKNGGAKSEREWAHGNADGACGNTGRDCGCSRERADRSFCAFNCIRQPQGRGGCDVLRAAWRESGWESICERCDRTRREGDRKFERAPGRYERRNYVD